MTTPFSLLTDVVSARFPRRWPQNRGFACAECAVALSGALERSCPDSSRVRVYVVCVCQIGYPACGGSGGRG